MTDFDPTALSPAARTLYGALARTNIVTDPLVTAEWWEHAADLVIRADRRARNDADIRPIQMSREQRNVLTHMAIGYRASGALHAYIATLDSLIGQYDAIGRNRTDPVTGERTWDDA